MNININNITNDKLFYDNSLKKVISNIKYKNRHIILNIENVEIFKLENNVLFIKNNYELRESLNNISNIFQERFKIDNFIFKNNLNNDIIEFTCFKKQVVNHNNNTNSISIFFSHLESIYKKIYCQCYVIKVNNL